MSFQQCAFTVAERFLRYVQIDTQSDPFSKTFPSTSKQKDLSRLLVEELHEMGVTDAVLDEHGYVYATIPANTTRDVPVLCFCSHVDTSPDCSGNGVKPVVHKNYNGGEIRLPDDSSQVLSPDNHPDLNAQIGNDIITASGKTLLGADDKSGVAILMDAAHYFMQRPEVNHGKIRILFTPDEEIGTGTDLVDLDKLGADFGYTLDGDVRGTFEDENFNADKATIVIDGVAVHPGFAKGKMVNAIKAASAIIAALPKDHLSPETTEDKEGFVHPVHFQGNGEKATIEFILRDFSEEGLQEQKIFLQKLMDRVLKDFTGAKGMLRVEQQYRNMQQVISQHPQVAAFALQAICEAGIEPRHQSIRGGTDGAMLSLKGLPCPNLFTGQHAFHSRQEWISIQDMEKAVEVVVRLCGIWEEKG